MKGKIQDEENVKREEIDEQDKGGCMNVVLNENYWQGIEINDKQPLIRGCDILNQSSRSVRRTSMRFHRVADACDVIEPHVKHHGLVSVAGHFPVQVISTIAAVTGDEYAGLRVIAMRQWNSGVACTTRSCGNTGYHLELDILIDEFGKLFAATPENKRIATFQA